MIKFIHLIMDSHVAITILIIYDKDPKRTQKGQYYVLHIIFHVSYML